ncbi:MAG: putative hemolysin [Arenicella sp.]
MEDYFSSILLLNTFPLSEVLWLTLVTLILLVLSAMISGSEVAFFSLSNEQLEECKRNGKATDLRILQLHKDPKLLLATILIINNLVNVAIVTITTYMLWLVLAGMNLEKNDTRGEWFHILVVTAIIVFFGEILPKVFANQRNLTFARLTSGLLFVSSKVLNPFSWLLTQFGDILEKKLQKKNKKKYSASVVELGTAVEMTTGKETTNEEKEILKSIVNFGTKTVRQIMRTRIDITAFDISTDFHQLMDKVNKCGYSRIPIYNETIDKIEGIIYVKDLLAHIEQNEHFDWQKLIRRNIFMVPENKKIDDLFKDFQAKRVHIAIVADEYGGTSGLISMEDIIEEIVGEINDEFDTDEVNYKRLDNKAYVFDAKTSLNDLCKILEIQNYFFDEVKGEAESLGGLMLELFGKLPNSGERISYKKFVFIITSVNQKRIKSIRIRLKDGKDILPHKEV